MDERFCKKCGSPMGGDFIFCPKCGAEAGVRVLSAADPNFSEEPENFCVYCGNEMREGAKFCDDCGAAVFKPKKTSFQQSGGASPSKKKGTPLKAAALLALVIILGAGGFMGMRSVFGDASRRAEERRAVAKPGSGEPPAQTPLSNPDNQAATDATDAQKTSAQNSETALVASSLDAPVVNEPIILAGPVPYSGIQPSRSAPDDTAPARRFDAAPRDGRTFTWSAPDSNGYSDLGVRDSSGRSEPGATLPAEVTGDSVRVRSAPNTEAEVLTHLSRGTLLGASRRYSSERDRFHWFSVDAGDGTGWVYGEYLNITQTVAEPPGAPTGEILIRTAPGDVEIAASADAPNQPNPLNNTAAPARQDNKKRAEQLVNEGRAFWTRKDWAGAYDRFSRAYELTPTDEIKIYVDNARMNMDIERSERRP